MATSTEKSKALLELIEILKQEKPFDEGFPVNEAIQKAKFIYNDGWRHNYSDITQFLLSSVTSQAYDNSQSQKLLQTMVMICNNIAALRDEIPLYITNQDDTKAINAGLGRLYDHINLELQRLTYLYKQFGPISDFVDNSQQTLKEFNRTSRSLKSEIDTQKREAVVFLGIFASIIVTFVAAFGVTNSFLSNVRCLDNLSAGLWCILAMAFIANVLFSLYSMILVVLGKIELKNVWSGWLRNGFNITLVVISFILIIIFYW